MSEQPLSVLMTTDAVGGVWRYCLDLSRQLARFRTTTTLVCLGPAPDHEQQAAAHQVPGLTLLQHGEPLEWMDDPWPGVDRSGQYLLALAQETRPDIVHLNGFCHGALSFRAPKVVVGHSCVLSWWEAVEGHPAPPTWRRYHERVALGLRGAQAVVAPTRTMLACLRNHYGVRGGQTIFNGSSASCPPSARLGEKEPFVLCAGRLWDRAKNVALLAEAAPRLDWPVFVAGAGDAPPSVTALGPLTHQALGAWMTRAAIYALPARYEPFGLSVLEAALHGAALVLGDIPSLREVWGDAALYVPPDDATALSAAINELSRDAVRREAFARQALARAQRYTLEQQALGYRQLYRRLLAERGSPGSWPFASRAGT